MVFVYLGIVTFDVDNFEEVNMLVLGEYLDLSSV